MKRFLLSVAFALKLQFIIFSSLAQAGTPLHPLDLGGIECNWGVLTMTAILFKDFDQGEHASGFDEPRAGLPNLAGDDPNLVAVCNAVACGLELIDENDPVCQ